MKKFPAKNYRSLLLVLVVGLALIVFYMLVDRIELAKHNEQLLARILMSEASIGNEPERIAVGLTVINRMKSVRTNRVRDAVTVNGFNHYATNQEPSQYPEYAQLAKRLLSGQIPDFTTGATQFFSPYSMPKEGESMQTQYFRVEADSGL